MLGSAACALAFPMTTAGQMHGAAAYTYVSECHIKNRSLHLNRAVPNVLNLTRHDSLDLDTSIYSSNSAKYPVTDVILLRTEELSSNGPLYIVNLTTNVLIIYIVST